MPSPSGEPALAARGAADISHVTVQVAANSSSSSSNCTGFQGAPLATP